MGLGKPMSKWALQESSGTVVGDSIGANTGTATSGNARRFNGTTDYVTFTNPIIPVGAKTIKFKFRKNGAPSTASAMITNASGTGTMVMLNTNGTISFTIAHTSSSFSTVTSVANVCDNNWHEIMLTMDGTTNVNGMKIFVDDMVTPNAQAKMASADVVAGANLYIGRNAANATFIGFDIDDIQITNGYMGAGTVVAWWKMDESSGTIVDSSSNAWTNTISGTTVLINDSMPIVKSDGAGGYCRYFNGRSDRITYTSQVLPLGAKSIRFKIRKPSKPLSTQIVLSNIYNATTDNGFMVQVDTRGYIRLLSAQGVAPSRIDVYTKINVCDGNWHDVICTWDGTVNTDGVKIYVDDMSTPNVTYTAKSIETTAVTSNLTIGARLNGTTYDLFLEADLKDIQISVGTGTERTDPKDLQIGDFIAASYQVGTSGSVGELHSLGTSPTTYIPSASSATPNGGFYYMYVGDDFLGRKMLVADRNIQNSISWDTLNTEGIASGSGLPLPLVNNDVKVKLPVPSTLPTNTANRVAFSSDGNYMSVAHAGSPYVTIYKRDGDTFTKLPDPSSLPAGNGQGVAFSPDGNYMSVAHATTPFVTIYKRSGDTFTKLANPDVLSPSISYKVAFSPDSNYMSIIHSGAPYVTIYKRNGDAFTKLADPSVLPANTGNDVAFSSDGNYMSVAHTTTPYITIYKRSGDTFTKLANPDVLPVSTGIGVAFSLDSNYMSVAHANTPFITIYKRNGDTFTKLANPDVLPTSTGNGVAFSSDGNYMSVAHATTPFVTIYKRSGDTFTKLANPSYLPVNTGNGVAFSPDGNYMSVAHATTPFVTIYKNQELCPSDEYNFTLRLLTGGVSSTDKDNEWDQIIFGSSLGGTITAGDNNIWNWSNVYSWTSTVSSTAGSRVVRGYATNNSYASNPTNTANSSGTLFRPVLLVESRITPIIFTGGIDRTTAHKEDVVLSGTVSQGSNPVSYKVMVGSTQVYPASGFTTPTPNDTVNVTITNDNLLLGSNTISLVALDGTTEKEIWTGTVTVTNTQPTATLSLERSTAHSENVTVSGTISESEGDIVSYRILANSNELVPWTVGSTVNYSIINTDLLIGDNTITVEYKDDFKGGTVQTWAGTVTITNNQPTASLTLDSTTVHGQDVNLSGSITDSDGDGVSYRILSNGTVLQDWVVSGTVNFVITNSVLQLGNNDIEVEYKDDYRGGVVQTWNGTISVLNSVPSATVTLSPLSVHYENPSITGTITDAETDSVSYRVLVNGVEKVPFTILSSSPVNFAYNINNDDLNIGDNNIKVEFKDNFKDGALGEWTGTVTCTNSTPSFTPLMVTETVGTRADALIQGTLDDSEGDKVSYRLLLNGVEFVGWVAFTTPSVTLDHMIPSASLNFGTNTIVIEFKDNYKTGGSGSWQSTIEKVNHAPTIDLSMVGATLDVTFNDDDTDKIQYCIKLNGSQVYPATDFTELLDVPTAYTKTFRSSDGIVIGSNNTIEIIVKDEFGLETTTTTTFIGQYSGIMFSDLAGNFYSTDLGEVLFYLDMGTIISGQITPSAPIRLLNLHNFKVTNLELTVDSSALPLGTAIELSKQDSPFLAESPLLLTDVLEYNQATVFHLRIATDPNAVGPATGNFIIYVKAEPTV